MKTATAVMKTRHAITQLNRAMLVRDRAIKREGARYSTTEDRRQAREVARLADNEIKAQRERLAKLCDFWRG